MSNVKLAEMKDGKGNRQEAASHYRKALAVACELAESGRLAPRDIWMVADLERRLAVAEGGKGGP